MPSRRTKRFPGPSPDTSPPASGVDRARSHLPDDLPRVAEYPGPRRHVPDHHRPGLDERPRPDTDPLQDRRVRPDPDVVLDHHRPAGERRAGPPPPEWRA